MTVLADRLHASSSDSFCGTPPQSAVLPWDMRLSALGLDSVARDRVERAVEGGVCAKRIPAFCEDPCDALHNLGLACGGVLTNAAALLFAPSSVPLVVCRSYDAAHAGVLLDGCDCFGPFDAAFEQACAFSSRNFSLAYGNDAACDGPKGRLLAGIVREALMNALQHRDYFHFAPVRLVVSPGYIEISNPGCFPDSAFLTACRSMHRLDPREFVERALGARPDPRNALLVQALYRFGAVDGQGAGIARIAIACRICALRVSLSNDDGWAVLRIGDPNR